MARTAADHSRLPAAGLIFPLMQTLAVRAAGGRPSSSLMATISVPAALGPILGPVIGQARHRRMAPLLAVSVLACHS